MTGEALSFKDVTLRYEAGAEPVLTAASFAVGSGERVALVGLNGAGKTTILLAVAGLVPHEGAISVCGTRLSRQTLPEVREKIGFLFNVPEDQLLFPKVIEDVAFGLLRRGADPRDAKEKGLGALERLDVAHLSESPLHHLSHGQKQRVALAGAIVLTPPLLLLDEPSAGLDPPGKRSLERLLPELDAAMLIATHDLGFASRLCSRFILVEQGRIVEVGARTYPRSDGAGASRDRREPTSARIRFHSRELPCQQRTPDCPRNSGPARDGSSVRRSVPFAWSGRPRWRTWSTTCATCPSRPGTSGTAGPSSTG